MGDISSNDIRIPKRILTTLLTSLSAGVVPRSGAPYIAIGRNAEITALLSDIEKSAEGASSVRFIIGRYGSGKSFLLQLIRGYALDRGYLTSDADLSPERRLYGSGGAGLATYRELIKNLACKASPDGGALPILLSRWLSGIKTELSQRVSPDSPDFRALAEAEISKQIACTESSVGGFDFSLVLRRYCQAIDEADDIAKSACLRYFRGEYSSRTEARSALGIRISEIVNDDNWYDYLKLWTQFARSAGYRGFVVIFDECVNLYKISNRISRENNYEKLLAMYNDALQGRAPGLSLIFGGTPKFLEDTRRGLFSYEALRSRLCDSRFARDGYFTMSSPVIRLKTLGQDELFALIKRLSSLYCLQYPETKELNDSDKLRFLEAELSRTGSDEMMTPREIIRDYLGALDILRENPEVSFENLIPKKPLTSNAHPDASSDLFDIEL